MIDVSAGVLADVAASARSRNKSLSPKPPTPSEPACRKLRRETGPGQTRGVFMQAGSPLEIFAGGTYRPSFAAFARDAFFHKSKSSQERQVGGTPILAGGAAYCQHRRSLMLGVTCGLKSPTK